MSNYEDRDTGVSRDPLGGPQTQVPPRRQESPQAYGYGYGAPYGRRFGGPGMGMHGGFSETKPFFMTSEFLATLLCVIAVAITAATASDIDSRLSIALISGLVAAFTVSRGIAKSGTRSRAADPRDDLDLRRSHDGEH
jgi:hypothetical protein